MKENESAYKAFAKVTLSSIYKIILIVDDNEKLVGIISQGDTFAHKNTPLIRAITEDMDVTVGEVCTRNFTFLTKEQDKHLYGTRMFVEKAFNEIPIINEDGIPVEIFGRFQAFFQQFVVNNWHIRTHYAKVIGAAAELAVYKGYDRMSVIEFGVAAGAGLRLAEIYAEEISHLLGIKIDVYGFDSGNGLLELHDYRDIPNLFASGQFQADSVRVQASLRSARLIVGDICDTAKTFLSGEVAPIGVMLVDVDLYRPTVAILDMLLEDDKFFLPEVFMYFDDATNNFEFQGETLAIKEFNARSKHAKISPELTRCSHRWAERVNASSIYLQYRPDTPIHEWGMNRLKVCMRFSHPKFARGPGSSKSLFLS